MGDLCNVVCLASTGTTEHPTRSHNLTLVEDLFTATVAGGMHPCSADKRIDRKRQYHILSAQEFLGGDYLIGF
jgi:hypothetical protein